MYGGIMFNFDDIGEKIKKLARILFVVGAIGYFLVGLFFAFYIPIKTDEPLMVIIGMLLMFVITAVGCVVSWLSVVVLYAFGQAVQSLCNIEKATKEISMKIDKIENLNSKTYLDIKDISSSIEQTNKLSGFIAKILRNTLVSENKSANSTEND